MKQKLLALCISIVSVTATEAQFYLRGQVKNVKDEPLPYVRIQLLSSNSFFYTGSTGSFGIPSTSKADSAELSLAGYETRRVLLNSDVMNELLLRTASGSSLPQKKKLLSLTIDKQHQDNNYRFIGGETYSQQIENEFVVTEKFPVTGFSLNVDKASYSNIRRFINMNSGVPKDAVRIEEMLNYFPQPELATEQGKTFAWQSRITDCPWNSSNKLFYVQMQSKKINYDSAPPATLVLLIDISGSMEMPNRLDLLKSGFRMMVKNLRAVDTIAVVTYGGKVAVALYPTAGNEQTKILSIIDSLEAGGETPGGSALRTAYNLIEHRVRNGSNNRIILATDGDFNVGEVTEESLMQLVTQKQKTGIYLTCLGVGMGNYKDSKLEALAKKGNGNFAYIDNIAEAEKVLVKESLQTFYVSASDAFLNMTFDPAYIKQYRLIGYDNHKDVLADSVPVFEGGEMGSGHTVTAVFEITPAVDLTSLNAPVANAELSYIPSGATAKVQELIPFYASYYTLETIESNYRFATLVTWLGLLLKESQYINTKSWNELVNMLTYFTNEQDYLRSEFIQIVLKAKEIYQPEKKKGRGKKKREE
jgi:Ca-activated chloride channel homolog